MLDILLEPMSISMRDDASNISERPSMLFSGIMSLSKFGKLYKPSSDDNLQFLSIRISKSSNSGMSWSSISLFERFKSFSYGRH